MNRLGKRAFFTLLNLFSLLTLACLPVVLSVHAAPNKQTQAMPAPEAIYKRIDAQGRVTYSNAPLAGGTRVELEPITLIPPTPSGSLVDPNLPRPVPAAAIVPVSAPALPPTMSAPALPVQPAPLPAATTVPVAATNVAEPVSITAAALVPPETPAPSIAVAVVSPVATPTIKRIPIPANVQKPLPTETLVQQRLDELKLRSIQLSIETEQRLMNEAKVQLAQENGASDGVRAIKASFSAAARNNSPNKMTQVPVITSEERAKVEHHFERVRDLQDQISMHEKNLADLRAHLKAENSTTKIASH